MEAESSAAFASAVLSGIRAGGGKMNAVEIEEAISALAEQPFNGGEFPFALCQALCEYFFGLQPLR
jgi:hypothetical protein